MISAKLSNLEMNKLAHKTVAKCMMHGPCGVTFPNAPCMEEGKCKKQYPRKFQSETVTDVNKYLIYRHKDMGHTILVHGIELDNHWVVLHYLSTQYDAHINFEVCNNIRAIKYLFKYVYKGHDRAIVENSHQNDNATEGDVVEINEIKKISIVTMYLHRKQCGASSSLICMSDFLPLSVCNTICPISKWCCLTMTMMCRKWQHS